MYLAANKSLPLVADHPGSGFYTTALRDKNDEAVRQHFTKDHVVCAGTYEGCGCGFFTLEHAEETPFKQCGAVELFTCWEGDQALAPNHRGAITLGEIATGALKWDTREFFTIQSAT
jgi:hypothetical protein